MPHYVIGDVQGCYDELVALTNKIKFNPDKDKLIFAGDLVNRGPKSLEVLNFCIKNKKSIKAVLGNHDLYLLYLIEHKKNNKSLKKILNADNISTIHKWLKKLPLLLEFKINKESFWVTHAGIPYVWDIKTAKKLSKEIQFALNNDSFRLLKNMWGDTPSKWRDNLKDYKRYRVIINYFTRMRYLDKEGSLKLRKKNLKPEENHIPWFEQTKDNLKDNQTIIFGTGQRLKEKQI